MNVRLGMAATSVAILILVSSFANAGGLNEAYKAELLDKLRTYEIKNNKRSAMSQAESNDLQTYCDESGLYLQRPECLEQKFIKDGLYVVMIGFVNDGSIPKAPNAVYVPSSSGGTFDYTSMNDFLLEWSDTAFRQYLGDNYHTFNSLKLKTVNADNVSIEMLISNADEIAHILTDPRITYINHVGAPEILEEITN